MSSKNLALLAKLANKLANGELTTRHLKWFLSLTDEQLAQYNPKPTPKFELLVDLGEIIVPENYDHATWLSRFSTENKKKFYDYNDSINDQNFSNPSRVLKAGDMISVKAYRQITKRETTSEERLAFLKSQKGNVFVGAQGVSLVWEQKCEQLVKGYTYASFDEKERLWVDSGSDHGVPGVYAYSGGGFNFSLGDFESGWPQSYAVLSFCDLEQTTVA